MFKQARPLKLAVSTENGRPMGVSSRMSVRPSTTCVGVQGGGVPAGAVAAQCLFGAANKTRAGRRPPPPAPGAMDRHAPEHCQGWGAAARSPACAALIGILLDWGRSPCQMLQRRS